MALPSMTTLTSCWGFALIRVTKSSAEWGALSRQLAEKPCVLRGHDRLLKRTHCTEIEHGILNFLRKYFPLCVCLS